MRKYDLYHKITTLNKQIIIDMLGSKVNHYCFVETGTNLGAGVDLALNLGFAQIISIDNDWDFYDQSWNRFKNQSGVSILFGDSRIILSDICNEVKLPCFFWLDAHGYETTPVIEELLAIKNRNNIQDIIAIDDIRLVRNNKDWGSTVTINKFQEAIGPSFITTYFDSCNGKNDILVFYHRKDND